MTEKWEKRLCKNLSRFGGIATGSHATEVGVTPVALTHEEGEPAPVLTATIGDVIFLEE
jgi:hypothetical protein